MEKLYNLTTDEEQNVWQQIQKDIAEFVFDYTVVIRQMNVPVILNIDIDPGGGFEGGYAFTTFSAPVANVPDFKFALHHQGFLDEIGKFFGMQDVVIGDPEFDENVIVKTNDEGRVKQLLSDDSVRELFKTLKNFNIHLPEKAGDEERMLALQMEEGITDVDKLKQLYHAFFQVHQALNAL